MYTCIYTYVCERVYVYVGTPFDVSATLMTVSVDETSGQLLYSEQKAQRLVIPVDPLLIRAAADPAILTLQLRHEMIEVGLVHG